MDQDRIPLGPDTRLLVLTGAGVSAESGVPTFRDANGLWAGHDVQQVASPAGFAADPALVWAFYSERRAGAAQVTPNAAHLALAAIEELLGDRFLLATQNVDGLHQAAGSTRVVEMHGSLWRARCSRCSRTPFDDRRFPIRPPLPTCELCAGDAAGPALLRPDIVWFGEALDADGAWRVSHFIREASWGGTPLVFLAIGTSGTVYPAAGLVDKARDYGATTWVVNLEAPDNAFRFDQVRLGRATEVVPRLLGMA